VNTWRGARGGVESRPRVMKLHIRVASSQHRGKSGSLFFTPPLFTRFFKTPVGANDLQGAFAVDFLFQSPQSFIYRIAFSQFDFSQNTVTSSPETLEAPASTLGFLFVRRERLFCRNVLSIGISQKMAGDVTQDAPSPPRRETEFCVSTLAKPSDCLFRKRLSEKLMGEARWAPRMGLRERAEHSLPVHRMALLPAPRTPGMESAH
jgi:hypothetical protein